MEFILKKYKEKTKYTTSFILIKPCYYIVEKLLINKDRKKQLKEIKQLKLMKNINNKKLFFITDLFSK